MTLTGTRFDDVCLGGAEFENVSLAEARMHDINLCDMDVSFFRMNGTKFHCGWAQQKPVSFEQCDLTGVRFKGCKLAQADLAECDVTGMKIDGIAVTDMLAAFKKSSEQARGGEHRQHAAAFVRRPMRAR